jgi:hypothetical protein
MNAAMKRNAGIIIVLCVLILAAGCCSTPANNAAENLRYPSGDDIYIPPSIAENNATPASVFPVVPVILPEKYRSPEFMGSFEDTIIESFECSNGSESYTTNYTLFTGSGGLRHICYTLSAVDNTENFTKIPLPPDILNASISPDDFVALPDHIYTSRIQITVGPNVTGESHTNPDGSGWVQNPGFPFLLNVTVDGTDVPDADDQVTVTKICHITPGIPRIQSSPDIMSSLPDITLKPGEEQTVNVTIRNSGNGITDAYFKIPARINANGWSFPLEADPGQLMPIPSGMHFTLVPSDMLTRNFRSYNDTLQVITGANTPPGKYTFPLVLCYHNLDPDNTTSPYFPFDPNSYCDTATQFTVDIH